MPHPESQSAPRVYVWDLLVRVFHWTLVAAFTVAYLTEGDWLTVHVWAGYVIGALVLARIIWGFVGTRHARFADFVYRPRIVLDYMWHLVTLRGGERYLGHSPGGGYMIVLLLMLLAATVGTGLVVYGGEEGAGPLAGIVSEATAEIVEAWHEVLANVTLILVLAHIAAVIFASFVYRENLVRAMVTGYKRS